MWVIVRKFAPISKSITGLCYKCKQLYYHFVTKIGRNSYKCLEWGQGLESMCLEPRLGHTSTPPGTLLYSARYLTLLRHVPYFTPPGTLHYSARYLTLLRQVPYIAPPGTLHYSARYLTLLRQVHFFTSPGILLYSASYLTLLREVPFFTTPGILLYSAR